MKHSGLKRAMPWHGYKVRWLHDGNQFVSDLVQLYHLGLLLAVFKVRGRDLLNVRSKFVPCLTLRENGMA